MKVVFINRFFYPDLSATSQLLSDLAFDLASQGVEVHVVASRLRYDDPHAVLPTLDRVRGVHVHRVWTSRFGRANLLGRAIDYLTFYFAAGLQLLRSLNASDVLVIKTDPPLIGLVASPCARMRGARVVNWIQDVFPEVAQELGLSIAKGRIGRFLQSWRDDTLRSADMNVVLGERMADYFVSRGVSADRVSVIHNWVNGEVIRPLERSDNALREKWGLGDAFIVGYSGNLGRAHEFETILMAAQALSAQSNIVFMFIGDGQGRVALEQAANELGLSHVRFQPYQAKEVLPFSLTLFDAHLVSLRPELEGLIVPSKFYGALAAGRPVLFLGDPEGEVAMVVNKYSCGQAICQGSGLELAGIIQKWASDERLVRQLGANARHVFDARFTKASALKNWAALLRIQFQSKVPEKQERAN